jgi:hypothetical protein
LTIEVFSHKRAFWPRTRTLSGFIVDHGPYQSCIIIEFVRNPAQNGAGIGLLVKKHAVGNVHARFKGPCATSHGTAVAERYATRENARHSSGK